MKKLILISLVIFFAILIVIVIFQQSKSSLFFADDYKPFKQIIKEGGFDRILVEIKNDLDYSPELLENKKADFIESYTEYLVPRIKDLKFSDLKFLDYVDDFWGPGEALFISTIGINPAAGWWFQKDFLYVLRRIDNKSPWTIEAKKIIEFGRFGGCIEKGSRGHWCYMDHQYYSYKNTPALMGIPNHNYGTLMYEGSGASGFTFYIYTIGYNKFDKKWKIDVNALGFPVEPKNSEDF